METLRQRLLGLCLPPLVLCLVDATVTLVGQPAQYWAGDYASLSEGSPTFHQLLELHPAAFAAGILVWVLVFVSAILLLPGVLALVASLVVTFAHAAGAATWLFFRFQYGYQACNALFLATAILTAVCVRWGWQAIPQRQYRLSLWPPVLRFGLLALLFGVAIYLSLWPRRAVDETHATQAQNLAALRAVAHSDAELARLADASRVKYLCLAGPEITDAGLKHLKRLPQLEGLLLRGLQITDAGLAPLDSLAGLQSLGLDGVQIGGPGLKHLKGLGKLRTLSLRGSQVTDAWLEHVGAICQLQELSIDSTRVTDAGLKNLKGLNQLQVLTLMGTMAGDAALESLNGLPQLKRLHLAYTRVTNAGLEHLQKLPQLEEVFLFCTHCTPEGAEKLQKALPKCKIEH